MKERIFPEIWLIRHGETAWSVSGQHTGRTDIALTEKGRRQAEALRKITSRQTFDLVMSSPMSRARDTCKLAGLEEQMIDDPNLREWDYGIYEGLTTEEIRQSTPSWNVWNSPITGGESLEQVGARASAVIDRITAREQKVVMFSHAHFLRIFASCWVTNLPSFGAHLMLEPCSISVLGFERERRAIKRWNVSITEEGWGVL